MAEPDPDENGAAHDRIVTVGHRSGNHHPADLAGLLGMSAVALVLVDPAGTVALLTPEAARLVGGGGMVRIRGGVLTLRRKEEDRALRDAMAALSPARPGGTLCLRTRQGVPVLVADLSRLPGGSTAIRLTPLADPPAPSAERLQLLFGLTRGEARVAAALRAGQGMSEIGADHGVAAETVRTQVKRIRAKTGTRSHAQLLALLMATGPGPAAL